MEDLKKKINFDPALLYYSTSNRDNDEDEKPSVMNIETYNTNNRKYICTVCGKRYFTNNSLNVHMNHHNPNERLNIEKDESNLDWKSRFVMNKGVSCNKIECNFIALDAVEYSKHVSSCEGTRVTEGSNFCELCKCYFSSENHVKAHIILQHPECSPNISMKEYDAEHTTISDPVCLYVSDSNTEDENALKKTVSHSMYPDSFFTKRKSKDVDVDILDGCKTELNTEHRSAEKANVQKQYDIINENVLVLNEDMNVITDESGNVSQPSEIKTLTHVVDNETFCSNSNSEVLNFDNNGTMVDENSKSMIIDSETNNANVAVFNSVDPCISQENLIVSYDDTSTCKNSDIHSVKDSETNNANVAAFNSVDPCISQENLIVSYDDTSTCKNSEIHSVKDSETNNANVAAFNSVDPCISQENLILSYDDTSTCKNSEIHSDKDSETNNANVAAFNSVDPCISQENLIVSYDDTSTCKNSEIHSVNKNNDPQNSEMFLNVNISPENVNDNVLIAESIKNASNDITSVSDHVESVLLADDSQSITQNDKRPVNDEVLLDMLNNSDEKKEFHELKTSSYYENFANMELITDSVSAQEIDRSDQYFGVEKNMYKLFKGDASFDYDSDVEVVYSSNKTEPISEDYSSELKQKSKKTEELHSLGNRENVNSSTKNKNLDSYNVSKTNQYQPVKKKYLKSCSKVNLQKIQPTKKNEIFHSTPKSDKSSPRKPVRSQLDKSSPAKVVADKVSTGKSSQPEKSKIIKSVTNNKKYEKNGALEKSCRTSVTNTKNTKKNDKHEKSVEKLSSVSSLSNTENEEFKLVPENSNIKEKNKKVVEKLNSVKSERNPGNKEFKLVPENSNTKEKNKKVVEKLNSVKSVPNPGNKEFKLVPENSNIKEKNKKVVEKLNSVKSEPNPGNKEFKLVPENSNIKEKNKKVVEKLNSVKSEPNPGNKEFKLVPENSNIKEKNKKEVKKLNSVKSEPNSENKNDNSNMKERSVRVRKKLILPDFEYEIDFKTDYPSTRDSIGSSKSTTTTSSKQNDADRRGRGRPRKSMLVDVNFDKKTNTNTSDNLVKLETKDNVSINKNNKISHLELSKNKQLNLSERNIDEDSEVFPLTVIESKSDESFSENTEIVNSKGSKEFPFSELSTSDLSIDFNKKKRGRPRKYNVDEISPERKIKDEYIQKRTRIMEIKLTDSAKKKRGRPRKVGVEDAIIGNNSTKSITDKGTINMSESLDQDTESDSEFELYEESKLDRTNESKNVDDLKTGTPSMLKKKRGRPRKFQEKNSIEKINSSSEETIEKDIESKFNIWVKKHRKTSLKFFKKAQINYEQRLLKKKMMRKMKKRHPSNVSTASLLQDPLIEKKRGRPRKSEVLQENHSQNSDDEIDPLATKTTVKKKEEFIDVQRTSSFSKSSQLKKDELFFKSMSRLIKEGKPRTCSSKKERLKHKRGRPKKFDLLNNKKTGPSKIEMLRQKLNLPDGIVLIKKKKRGRPNKISIENVITFDADGNYTKDQLNNFVSNMKGIEESKVNETENTSTEMEDTGTNNIESSTTEMIDASTNNIESSTAEMIDASTNNIESSTSEMIDASTNNIESSTSEMIDASTNNIESSTTEMIDASTNNMETSTTGTCPVEQEISENQSPSSKKKRYQRKLTKGNKKSKKEETESNVNDLMDETINIDKDLYLADVKNCAKFLKVFKKIIHNEESNSLVTCGRCKKQMTLRHYKRNHQISHYFLCWLEGETEIDLNDDDECIRILQSHINPEALKKKAIRFNCEQCGDVRKSVIGYVSHVRFCQKKDCPELLEKCKLCGKLLKPSSLKFHSKLHDSAKTKLLSVEAEQNSLNSDNENSSMDETEKKSNTGKKNYLQSFERKTITKIIVLEDDQFWTNLKTSYDLYMCMGLSCRHMTLSKDDLKSHILHCAANFCEFSCFACPYKTKYESEIIYHSKKGCKHDTETKGTKEKTDINVVESDIGRRVSTRVKKRKYKYDSDEFTDEDSKKKKDQDFKLNDADVQVLSDSDFDNSDSGEILNKKSRFKRKKFNPSITSMSDDISIRQAFQNYCLSRTCDPLNWTVEVRLKTFSFCPVHVELKTNIKDWDTYSISDLSKHSPVELRSMKIAFDNESFTEFNLFQSDVIKGVPVCFTGGPVWAMAWAPLAAFISEQYLAVSGLQNMNHLIKINSAAKFPSLIQIWKFSSLDNISNDIHKPLLSLAIQHEYGAVWSMEWCPSGGYDNSSTPCRLGILACATSAGCAVIYSIPKIDCGTENTNNILSKEPDLILKVRTDNVQCTRIVWQRNFQHNFMYGGFSNGMVVIWNIGTGSPILKDNRFIYPHRTFDAHTTTITGLDIHWLDNCRFLLTSSTDRVTKYWDLEDLSGPMYESEKSSPALDAVWMQHWIVTAQGQDVVSTTESNAFVAHPRDLIEKKKPFFNIRDSIWSVAYSDWNDTVAVSTNGGYVSVYAAKYLSLLTYKHAEFEKTVTTTKLLPLDKENKISESDESNSLLNVENPFDCSTVIKNYGLQFSDRMKQKINSENLNFGIEKSNVTSVNKICWNQNYNSFNWLAIGYECGFVRVVRVERFDKHHLTKFYKMNENSSITLI